MGDAVFGIIGTVLGTILGWILNTISQKGKLHIIVVNWTDSFQHCDSFGGLAESNSIDGTEYYSFNLTIDVHNSSGEPMIMRDIRLIFNDGTSDIHNCVPMDADTKRYSGHRYIYNEIAPVNIPPKTIVQLHLHGSAGHEKLSFIWKTQRVFMSFKDIRDKERRTLIKTEKYCSHFSRTQ